MICGGFVLTIGVVSGSNDQNALLGVYRKKMIVS